MDPIARARATPGVFNLAASGSRGVSGCGGAGSGETTGGGESTTCSAGMRFIVAAKTNNAKAAGFMMEVYSSKSGPIAGVVSGRRLV